MIVNHYNVWPVFDVYANVDRRDLGGVGAEVRKIMREEEPHLPRGTSFDLRGQVETMQSSFFRLGLGMIFAVVLVYLLMTVNFQSWLDPFIILTALPGAMAGILWMLFVTGTTLSVPSLMGAIMCIGVATANSILMVTFANDERETCLLRARRHAFRRACAGPAGADDGHCDDSRHGSDGAGPGRRRRAECAAGTRGDRRPDVRHGHDAVRGSDYLHVTCGRNLRWITSDWTNRTGAGVRPMQLMRYTEPDKLSRPADADRRAITQGESGAEAATPGIEGASHGSTDRLPAKLWHPSGVTIWAIFLAACVLIVVAFSRRVHSAAKANGT